LSIGIDFGIGIGLVSYRNQKSWYRPSLALFKFSELQMRRSFGGGAQSGAALFKKNFICELYQELLTIK
jgi:hypothetical protein